MDIPTVVIVGRPNVGKSSLFNALCGQRVAIVEPTAGVTRDRISRTVSRAETTFELVDTGGMGLEDADELAEDVQMQILIAIEQAHLVLLAVDGRQGLQPLDNEIAQRLRQAGKDAIVVVNKCDRPADEALAADFYSLGLPEVRVASATQRRGIEDLLDAVAEVLPEARPPDLEAPEPMRIAFVGRRNVGKSTLINYLANEPRVLVSEVPGTTRDSVDVRFRMGDLEFIAIDTAGLRRAKQIKDSIDYYSVARSRNSIRRADVVVLMMEAPMEIGRLEKQLADHVSSLYKPCVLAVNKMDLAPGMEAEQFELYVRDRLPGVAFAPVVCISAETGRDVERLLGVAQLLHVQGLIRVPTGEINRAMQEAMDRQRPPSTSTTLCKIYYATQVSVEPPTIVLFTNEPSLITDDYKRYLANYLRARFEYNAIPIRFRVRARKRVPWSERVQEDGR